MLQSSLSQPSQWGEVWAANWLGNSGRPPILQLLRFRNRLQTQHKGSFFWGSRTELTCTRDAAVLDQQREVCSWTSHQNESNGPAPDWGKEPGGFQRLAVPWIFLIFILAFGW